MSHEPTDIRTYLSLMAQFQCTTLTMDQVRAVIPVAPKTIRNWVSAGTFPKPLPGDVWPLQDVADWIDRQRSAA